MRREPIRVSAIVGIVAALSLPALAGTRQQPAPAKPVEPAARPAPAPAHPAVRPAPVHPAEATASGSNANEIARRRLFILCVRGMDARRRGFGSTILSSRQA